MLQTKLDLKRTLIGTPVEILLYVRDEMVCYSDKKNLTSDIIIERATGVFKRRPKGKKRRGRFILSF